MVLTRMSFDLILYDRKKERDPLGYHDAMQMQYCTE